MQHGADHPQIFHSFTAEADIGEARDGAARGWDLDGWVGGDVNRLWLKSEKKDFGKYERKSEIQALYGRNVRQFWDVQFGARHDFKTDFSDQSVDYLTLGLEGLAPYFFESDAHIFVSDQGNFSARLKQEIDIFITQKLITQPYFEADFFAQNIPELNVRSGLAEFEFGTITRYEISRKFAPYLALRCHKKTFGTASLARQTGEKTDNFIAAIGVRVRF
jgi:copper resistance protein B